MACDSAGFRSVADDVILAGGYSLTSPCPTEQQNVSHTRHTTSLTVFVRSGGLTIFAISIRQNLSSGCVLALVPCILHVEASQAVAADLLATAPCGGGASQEPKWDSRWAYRQRQISLVFGTKNSLHNVK